MPKYPAFKYETLILIIIIVYFIYSLIVFEMSHFFPEFRVFFVALALGLWIPWITQSAIPLQRRNAMDVVLMFPSNDSVCYNHTRFVTRVKVDETVECKEIYSKKCISHPVTSFKAAKVKVCTETFKENCDIKYFYELHSFNVTVCQERRSHCESSQEERCTRIQHTDCEENSVNREVQCKLRTKEICAPSLCKDEKDVKDCRRVLKSMIQEIPKEKCNLVPFISCRNETKLIPQIQKQLECQEVPTRVCVDLNKDPQVVKELKVDLICSSGPWSNYEDWSNCSSNCGLGITARRRKCSNEGHCNGRSFQSGLCKGEKDCPVTSSPSDPAKEDEAVFTPNFEASEIDEFEDEPCTLRGIRLESKYGWTRTLKEELTLKDCRLICQNVLYCHYYTYIETLSSKRCILMDSISDYDTGSLGSEIAISGSNDCYYVSHYLPSYDNETIGKSV